MTIYKGELVVFGLVALILGWMAGSWNASRQYEKAIDPIELVTFDGLACKHSFDGRVCSFNVRTRDETTKGR